MSVYTERARYVPVEMGFNIKRRPIEPHTFTAEMRFDDWRQDVSMDPIRNVDDPGRGQARTL